MNQERKNSNKLWIRIGIAVGILVLFFFAFLLFQRNNLEEGQIPEETSETLQEDDALMPMVVIETPHKISVSKKEDFLVDMLVTELEDSIYPAASFSISFDSSCLEFVGVEEGNLFVKKEDTGSQVKRKLPEWSCNVEQSNETGIINIMYLDLTGGQNAFAKELMSEEYNVVLRLRFRLRGSARVNEIYDLTIEDAIFAASDEKQSLSMYQGTLETKDGRVVVGE